MSDDLRRLAEAATPGPWCFYRGDLWTGTAAELEAFDAMQGDFDPDDFKNDHLFHGDPVRPEDAAFIAAARNALPALLDERDKLRREYRMQIGRAEQNERDLAAANARLTERLGGECECGPWHPGMDGPEETCPEHGRTLADWRNIASEVIGRENTLRERITALEADLDAAKRWNTAAKIERDEKQARIDKALALSGDEKETAWRKWREAREKEGWDFGSGHEASFYQDAFDAGWEARDDILRSALSDTAGPEAHERAELWLIRNSKTGKWFMGSAGGDDGIWARNIAMSVVYTSPENGPVYGLPESGEWVRFTAGPEGNEE